MSWTPSPLSEPAGSPAAAARAEADVTSVDGLGQGAALDATPARDGARLAEGPDIDQLETALRAVDRALARLDDGSYGRCEDCGAAIDDARLAVDPTAARCAAH
jgi:hypothetical protein